MPRHRNILMRKTARAMRRPVYIDGPDPLCSRFSLQCTTTLGTSLPSDTYHSHSGMVYLSRALGCNEVDEGRCALCEPTIQVLLLRRD